MIEKTLVILKPGCLQRAIVGEIISRFETKGLKMVALKLSNVSKLQAETHYGEHKGKPFYPELVEYIVSSPVVLLVLEGEECINIVRKMAGPTKIEDAIPGTIRGDYSMHTGKNIIHTSDSKDSASREINIFFKPDEILSYVDPNNPWI